MILVTGGAGYIGSHTCVALAQAGLPVLVLDNFCNSRPDVLERVATRQPEIAAQLRQVWQSPLIASDPMVWRKDLPQELKRKIKDFFLAYGKVGPDAAREQAQLKKLTLGGFQDTSNAQLKPVRQLELCKKKHKLEADTALQADEKKAKLDEIGRKLADLAKS